MPARVVLKRRIGRIYAALRAGAGARQRKLALLYHAVGDSAEATPCDVFRDHLGVVAAMVELRPLAKLLDPDDRPGPAVAITFDDGYAALRDRAAPVLADFGGTATVFLNAGELAATERQRSRAQDGYYPHERFLSWQDVDALIAAGWDVGSHGVRHIDLTTSDAATVEREVVHSRAIIERRLERPCAMFAYPWGRSNAAVRRRVLAAGYRYAFAGGHSGLTPDSDPLALPRINVARDYSCDDLAAILRGDWDYLDWLARAKALSA